MIFKNRADAGKQLAERLAALRGQKDLLVLGLARGGMVVAEEIALMLHLPLNVIVVRKVGAPGNEELALGAIAETGEGVFNEAIIAYLGITPSQLDEEVRRQQARIEERLRQYRKGGTAPDLKGKTVILVDDGIATGASIRVAIRSLRSSGVAKILLAVPVAAPEALKKIEQEVDQIVCLYRPLYFDAVGGFYAVFDQVLDEEIVAILARSSEPR